MKIKRVREPRLSMREHFDPSLPVSASNLPPGIPPEGIAALNQAAIMQPSVAVNPVTGILQPTQNVISPVTPDLTDAEITTPVVDNSILTPEQVAALDAALSGLPGEVSDVSKLVNSKDVEYDVKIGGGSKAAQQELSQPSVNLTPTQKEVDKIVSAAVTDNQLAAANSGSSVKDAADVVAALTNQLANTDMSSDAATKIAFQVSQIAGQATTASLKENMNPDDVTLAAAAQVLASQALVEAAAKREDEAQKALDATTSPDEYNSAAMDLKNAQTIADEAAQDLAIVQGQDAAATQKAADLMNTLGKTTPGSTLSVKTNFFDQLVNYIYKTLYE
jgi:hypothetical protein